MLNCEAAFYLRFGALRLDLVWSNCECVIQEPTYSCPGVVSPITCSVVVHRSGQSHHLLCCCSQEWSVPSLALLLFPEWSVLLLALLLFPGVVSPVTCSVVVPRSGQSHHLLCCCWSFFFLFHSVIHYTQTCVSDTLNF